MLTVTTRVLVDLKPQADLSVLLFFFLIFIEKEISFSTLSLNNEIFANYQGRGAPV